MRRREIQPLELKLPDGVKPSQLWTLKEAARQMQLNYQSVRHWFQGRTLNGFLAYRIEGRYYVRAADFVRWIESHAKPV